MKSVMDLHTHSVSSGHHTRDTVTDMAREAAKRAAIVGHRQRQGALSILAFKVHSIARPCGIGIRRCAFGLRRRHHTLRLRRLFDMFNRFIHTVHDTRQRPAKETGPGFTSGSHGISNTACTHFARCMLQHIHEQRVQNNSPLRNQRTIC